jgi:hypothetical protein
MRTSLDLNFSVKSLVRLFAAIILLLFVLHLVVTLRQVAVDASQLSGTQHGILRIFNLAAEANPPTWYQSMAIAFAGLLLALITLAKKESGERFSWFWGLLTAVFFFLSCDEAAGIHEAIGSFAEKASPTFGIHPYGWLIPYALIGLVLVAFGWRFLFSLEPRFRYLFVGAGLVYVFAAVGMEVVESFSDRYAGHDSVLSITLRGIEETLEATGILIFNFGLLSYLRQNYQEIHLRLRP